MYAADPTTATEWFGFVVIMAVLAGLIGFLVERSRARARAAQVAHQRAIARLPEEYRPRWLRHRTLWILLYFLNSAMIALLRAMSSEDVALVYALATFIPFTILLVRQAKARDRRIKESVRARRTQMDYRQLRDLVTTLEEVYGPDMKELRTLLPPDAAR